MGKTPKQKGALPSGNIRIQVYDYTDSSGKKHYKSFTGRNKTEAKDKAQKWKVMREKEREEDIEDITVYEAVKRYIDIKCGVLSPATHREYLSTRERYLKTTIGEKRLSEIRNASIQLWISELAAKGLSPKTVRNVYGLLSATLDMFLPGLKVKVTLPQRKKPNLYCPNDNDISLLLQSIKGTELELAVLLAAFGPMRRGEICALTDRDIVGNTIYVRHSMVMGPDKTWVIKSPKTTGSERGIEFPPFVIDKLRGKTGQLIKMNPNMVTDRFIRALSKINVPKFRFHDLRHYSASIMHAIGVPDQYIMSRGGWASDRVMKAIYRNTIDLESVRQNKKINQHFSSVGNKVSHEVSHEAMKAL